MTPTSASDPLSRVARACEHLRNGRFVAVYDADGREEETDLFVAAEHVTPDAIRVLRSDAGGLVFLAVHADIGKKLGLPFLQDLFADAAAKYPVLKELIPNDIRYDTRSSFSLTLNHRKTFTGITDNDRALTISEFANVSEAAAKLPDAEARRLFGESFRAPGHVHLCVATDRLLETRQGHTELGVALAVMAGVVPVLAGAEMMGRGIALPKAEAQAYAAKNGASYLEGKDILAAWAKFKEGQADWLAQPTAP